MRRSLAAGGPEPESLRPRDGDARNAERIRLFLGELPHVLWAMDAEGTFLLSEGGALGELGLRPGEIVGRNAFEMYAGEPEILGHLRRALAGKEAAWQIRFQGRVFETITRPVFGAGDAVEAVVAISADITGRQNAEDLLRESEARYRQLFETSPLPMCVYDAETLRFLAVNDAAVARYGWPTPEFLARTLPEIEAGSLPPSETLPGSTPAVARRARHRRRDGSVIEVRVATHALELGARPARLMLVEDMTEGLRAESLHAALYRIAEITASASDLGSFYEELHRIVGELMYARNFYIAISDEAAGVIRFPYFVDEFDPPPEPIRLGQGLTGEVLRTGRPLMLAGAEIEERVAAGELDAQGTTTVDWVGVPLRSGDRTFGVLTVQSYSDSIRYGVREKELLTFVSQHIATAVERKRAADALARSERQYRSLFENANDAVLIIDPDTRRILNANRRAGETYGYAPADLVGMALDDLVDEPGTAAVEIARIVREGSIRNVGSAHRARDGTPIDMLVSASMMEYEGGRAILSIHHDVTETRRAERQIERLAYEDALTGLANRVRFEDRLGIALATARRESHPLAVLFIDLDRFKVVNDSLGHKVGDILLQQAADRLLPLIRLSDTLARVGGDEFVLLLSKIDQRDSAAVVARKVQEMFRKPFRIGHRELFVTPSIGISVFPDDGDDADSLVKNADAAMYAAKQRGRDNYQFYSRSGQRGGIERLELESKLHHAIENEEFRVHFQPQVSLRSGLITGVEALVRWKHPTRGFLLPADFVPLAEDSGLIVDLGMLVLRLACRQARAWRNKGYRDLSVAVNLSIRQLQESDFAARVREVLDETALPPGQLRLEITESVAMQNLEVSIEALGRLKRLGVGITMDDFGTGYSSLSYLKILPVDTLKIDRSFIRDVAEDTNDASIVRASIVLAHELRLRVVAEGVETPEQLQFLRQHQCDEVQGFLLSP
ncbi:MAG TPA: EAL domain-containing protein, partial [Thermoanaerobaculia bacterium]|nr:EAL domain-containing protein [Thermoanaerobaculia bacterium]